MSRVTRRALLAILCGAFSCAPVTAPRLPTPDDLGSSSAVSFLTSTLRPFPNGNSRGRLAITDAESGRAAIYDSALVTLVLIRAGQRTAAASVLLGLAALQRSDGGIPFSFTMPAPDPAVRYERSGAMAWAGYAAAEYLDAEDGGPARDEILRFAQAAAGYLLAHQISVSTDPRAGLVLGGAGNLRYEDAGTDVREIIEPGAIEWASVEHNIDAYFFLRALARATGTSSYAQAAETIARALVARAWNPSAGQFVQGLPAEGRDETAALDCASWGSVLLSAIGKPRRAAIALDTADREYASRDPSSHAPGHRPYRAGPVFDEVLARHFAMQLPETRWERLALVWPEGSAGVAFAALRAGKPDRARAILDGLDVLRDADGSLPTSTVEVAFLFDRKPSIAATAWVELVRFELERPADRPTLWAP
jgi:hypothetical protein